MYLKFISSVHLMKIDYFRAPFASHTLRVKFRLKASTPPIFNNFAFRIYLGRYAGNDHIPLNKHLLFRTQER